LDTTSTTATLTMNWTTTGRIDRMPESGSFDASLDHDWFAVNLIAGHDYEFSALGITGGLNDIAIDLRNSSRAILNSQAAVNGAFTYTATSSGTVYLEIGAGGNNPAGQIGNYEIIASDNGADTTLDTASTNASLTMGGTSNGRINGAPESGSFDTSRDHDWWAVSLLAGHSYTFSAVKWPGALSDNLNDVAIELRDSNRTILDSQGLVDGGAITPSSFTYTATSSGTAYLDVSAGGNNPAGLIGNYQVTVTDNSDIVLDTASTDASLMLGGVLNEGAIDAVPESGSFNTTFDHDWFAVRLIAGHDYAFSAQGSISLPNVAIVLRNSSRAILNTPGALQNAFNYTAISSATGYLDVSAGGNFPSQTGNYSIFVNDYGADTALDTASTTASLTMGAGTNTGRINVIPESGSFNTALDHDWWAVNLIAGHDYEFSAQGSTGNLNRIAIDLRNSSRTILNSQGVVDNALPSFTYTATSSGTVYLDISGGGNDPASQIGNYSIFAQDKGADTALDTASTNASLTIGVLTTGRIDGMPESGSFDTSLDHDWLAVSLIAGHHYTFSAFGTDDLNDVAIDLRDSSRTILDGQGVVDGGVAHLSSFTYTATSSGTEYLDISAGGSNPASLAGGYQITVTDNGGPDTVLDTASTGATLTTGGAAGTIDAVPESGSFDASLDHDWFAVNLVAGHDYGFTANTVSFGLSELAIDLRNSSRTILNSQGVVDGGLAIFGYSAISSGTEYLDISAGGNNAVNETGTYSISVSDLGSDTALDTSSTNANLSIGDFTTLGKNQRGAGERQFRHIARPRLVGGQSGCGPSLHFLGLDLARPDGQYERCCDRSEGFQPEHTR
jgi:hypothetical protein